MIYRIAEERKPRYADLESPLYVELFCRTVRRSTVVEVSEMLPVIDDCWLADAQGERFVSELRLVAVDLVARDRTRS